MSLCAVLPAVPLVYVARAKRCKNKQKKECCVNRIHECFEKLADEIPRRGAPQEGVLFSTQHTRLRNGDLPIVLRPPHSLGAWLPEGGRETNCYNYIDHEYSCGRMSSLSEGRGLASRWRRIRDVEGLV
jgi:hypothetical protein